MSKDEAYPKKWEDMNKEFQYLWKKYDRDDWDPKNLGDYCMMLESMIMNYLSRNKVLEPAKHIQSSEEIRPTLLFKNYDYVDQTKSQKENGKEFGPGSGLYHGKMDKYKSVKDFINSDRKRKRKQRKKALREILEIT